MKNKYVFLIRAYNESPRIVNVIQSIFDAGFSEIIIVDDGSNDGTQDILSKNFEGKLHIIRHILNRGGGAAMETGFEYIRRNAEKYHWKYVITFDADGQMDISDMKNFIDFEQKNSNVQVIFGSRFIKKTNSNVPWYRRITLVGGKIFTSFISGVHLTDAHNGYRMISVDVLHKFHLTMDGMEYASELIDEIYSRGYTIFEVPVNIHYDDYTLKKGQRFGGAIRIAFRMIFRKFF